MGRGMETGVVLIAVIVLARVGKSEFSDMHFSAWPLRVISTWGESHRNLWELLEAGPNSLILVFKEMSLPEIN